MRDLDVIGTVSLNVFVEPVALVDPHSIKSFRAFLAFQHVMLQRDGPWMTAGQLEVSRKYAQDLIDHQRQLARNRKYKISSGRDVFYCTDETKRNGTRYLVSQMCSCLLVTSKDMRFFGAGPLFFGSLLHVCERLQAALPSCMDRRAEAWHA